MTDGQKCPGDQVLRHDFASAGVDRPSIVALQSMLSTWPIDWEPGLGEEDEWCGFWWCQDRKGSVDRVSADPDEDYATDFARTVAMLRNASPVLLDIAAAALAFTEADANDSDMELIDLRVSLAKARP